MEDPDGLPEAMDTFITSPVLESPRGLGRGAKPPRGSNPSSAHRAASKGGGLGSRSRVHSQLLHWELLHDLASSSSLCKATDIDIECRLSLNRIIYLHTNNNHAFIV